MAVFEGIPFLNMKCIFNVWSEFGMNQERSPRYFPEKCKGRPYNRWLYPEEKTNVEDVENSI